MKIKKFFLHFFSIVNKHKVKLLLPTFVDIVGFVLASIVYSHFFLKIHPYLVDLVNIIGPVLGQELASISSQGELMALAGSAMRLQSAFNTITGLLFWMAVSLFVIWLVSQLISWFFVKKTVKLVAFWRYVRDFSIVSVVAFILSLIFVKVLFKLTFISGIASGKTVDPRTVSIILLVFLIVLLYLVIVFYLNCGDKNMFKKSVRRLIQVRMIGAFIGSFVLAFFLGWLLYQCTVLLSLATGSSVALFAPVYLLMFPLFTLIKLFYHTIP